MNSAVERLNSREHLAFGRGVHSCPGANLARAEARISIERLLDRMADIAISDAEHGPVGARRYEYHAHLHPARAHPTPSDVHTGRLTGHSRPGRPSVVLAGSPLA